MPDPTMTDAAARAMAHLVAMKDATSTLVEAALALCPTEPTLDDERLSYVEIQVQRADLAAFRVAVVAYRKARGGDRGE